MKNIFVLILCLLGLNRPIFSQTYTPFPDSNAMWTDEIFDPLCNLTQLCAINQYTITGDTLINGRIYKKLNKSGYLISQSFQYTYYSEYAGAYRQEISNKKVYYFPPYYFPQIDTLLYDFDLHVGDSLPLTYIYPMNDCNAVVDTIDSVSVGSTYRKRFHIATTGTLPRETWLIEGIGCTHGLFASVCVGWESWQYLTCFKQNDSIFYPSYNTDCNLITSISEKTNKSNSVLVFPNPVRTILTIQIPYNIGVIDIEIFDLLGQKQYLYSGETQYFMPEINVSKWPEGVYIVKVMTASQILKLGKIILTRE